MLAAFLTVERSNKVAVIVHSSLQLVNICVASSIPTRLSKPSTVRRAENPLNQ